MLTSKTSAVARANSPVVYSKVYCARQARDTTYHPLFASLFAVCSLDVEDKDFAIVASVQPDSLCGLLWTMFVIHDIELCIKEQVEKGTLATGLATNHRHCAVVSALLPKALVFEPLLELRAESILVSL